METTLFAAAAAAARADSVLLLSLQRRSLGGLVEVVVRSEGGRLAGEGSSRACLARPGLAWRVVVVVVVGRVRERASRRPACQMLLFGVFLLTSALVSPRQGARAESNLSSKFQLSSAKEQNGKGVFALPFSLPERVEMGLRARACFCCCVSGKKHQGFRCGNRHYAPWVCVWRETGRRSRRGKGKGLHSPFDLLQKCLQG